MARKPPLTNIYDFYDELSELLARCEIHTPDVAASLVSAAVALAAADGCSPDAQRQAIEKFAENAVRKLIHFSRANDIRH